MIDALIAGLLRLQTWMRRYNFASRIRFKSVIGAPHVIFPVVATKEIKPDWLIAQIQKAKLEKKPVKFVRCPGMHDYTLEGYLIRAHTDIHIKANSVGVVVTTPHVSDPKLMPAEMDYEVVEGLPQIDGVKPKVIKIPLPYGIYMEPGHSAHLLPALMHADYLDKLFVYPGTVDYDEFTTANLIITVLKPCEFVIPAGTPILHALPFKRVSYHGICGPATSKELARHQHRFASRVMGFYRRMFHSKKIYTSEVQE